jgi:mercuric ion transport protein
MTMQSPIRAILAAVGGVAAAAVSALCCAGPLVAVALGMSGAGFAATFEPLRPWFVAGTVASLGAGFVIVRREEQRACEPGTLCASPVARRRMKMALWAATIIAIPLATFPWWSAWVLG